MYRLRLTTKLKICPLIRVKRGISQTQCTESKWNYAVYSQRVDLGRQIFEESAVKDLIENQPKWSAHMINDSVQGLSNSESIYEQISNTHSSIESTQDLFAKMGQLSLQNEYEQLDQLISEIKEKCISNLSFESISELMKEQHPKAILQHISEQEKNSLTLKTKKKGTSVECCMYDEKNEKLASVTHENEKEAERLVCLQILNGKFATQFSNFDLDISSLPLEEDVHFGLPGRKREITLEKACDESFGFSIQGGEKRVIHNKEYIQYHTTTPIFISNIEKSSPADLSGLLVGDVILSVGDHSLQNVSHKQAVNTLKKFLVHDRVSFNVVHNENEMMKYQTEKNYLEREKERIRETMSSNQMGKWHAARSKEDPEQYFLEKFEHKKRQFQHHKARKAIRLWDFPYKK